MVSNDILVLRKTCSKCDKVLIFRAIVCLSIRESVVPE